MSKTEKISKRSTSRKKTKKGFLHNDGEQFFAAIVILLVIGTLNVYSSTFYMNLHSADAVTHHLMRHAAYILAGGALGFVAFSWDYRSVRKCMNFWVAATILLLILVMVGGTTVNGARRWLSLGFITLQPSEIAKVVAIIWSASCLADIRERGREAHLLKPFLQMLGIRIGARLPAEETFAGHWKAFFVPLIFAGFVFLQPDLGTAILILAGPFALYTLAGVRGKELCALIATGFLLGVAAVVSAPYRMERIRAWYDPFSHARDIGYQVVQSIIAVGSGGVLGQGFGQGHSKFAYLPEQYTDFAFAVFAQEGGFFLSALVPLLFTWLLYTGIRIAHRTKDKYGKYVAFGFTFLLVGQGVYNVAMTTGLLPVTGVPLPFLSFGGSAMVMNLIMVGTVLGIEKKTREREEYEAHMAHVEALTAGIPPVRNWRVPH